MKEHLFNDILVESSKYMDVDSLNKFRTSIVAILDKYEISLISTELTEYVDYTPDYFQAYLVNMKIEGSSDKTIYNYSNYLRDFFSSVHKPVEQITTNDIRLYLATTQRNRGICNASLERRRACISAFFSWILNEGFIKKNPTFNIKPIKTTSKPREPLTELEVEIIRKHCKDDLRLEAMFEFFYSTGCRVSELTNCNISDCDFNDRTVVLFGKGSKYRTSFLSYKCILALKAYLNSRTDDDKALFVSKKVPHQRLKKEAVESVLKKLGNDSGIDNLIPHRIRHTTATVLMDRKVPVTEIQAILGHSNLNTTMIYAKTNMEDVKRDHSKYIV